MTDHIPRDAKQIEKSTERIPDEIRNMPGTRVSHWYHRCAMRRAAGKPLTGPYYWVPEPISLDRTAGVNWVLMEFYDRDYSKDDQVMHTQVWSEVINHLGFKWRLDPNVLDRKLGNHPYGLPRGRVARMANGQYGIAHGNDCPVPDWEVRIKRAFNLNDANAQIYFDDHERMLPTHPEAVQQALHPTLDLGIKDKVADFDDDWENDS